MFQQVREYRVIQVNKDMTILREMYCSSLAEAVTAEHRAVKEARAEGNDTAFTRIYAKVTRDLWIWLS